jgi:predicted ArsR family transcriptional regulator
VVINTQDNLIHALLTIGPMTAQELSLQLRVPIREIQSILKRMQESRLVFIHDYDTGQPMYAYGQGRNAKPPTPPQIDHTFNARLAAKKHPELGIWSRLV